MNARNWRQRTFGDIAVLALIAAALLFSAAVPGAGKIYRSVDEKGNVTYTETPPASGAKSRAIPIAPPPPEEDVKRAESEARRIKEEADAMERERIERTERLRRTEEPAPALTTPVGPSDKNPLPALLPGLTPNLTPEEIERYLKDNSYQPPSRPSPEPRR